MSAFAVPGLPHLDYPPLIPAAVALGWKIVGTMTPVVPIVLHGLIFAALLCCFRKTWTLVLLGAVALGYATYQYADLSIALALTGATLAYNAKRSALVGVALGLGALTKNEGAMILVSFIAVWSVLEWRVPWRALLTALPFLLALGLFKLSVPTSNDIMGSSGITERLLDAERYLYIVPQMLKGIFTFGLGAFGLLAAGLILTQTRVRLSVPLVAVAVAWLGYLTIYAITPNDLAWHIASSYDRLLLQLFPALVLACTRSVDLTSARSP